jgi:hypothetical protein
MIAFLPDKAIDLVDRAAAKVIRLTNVTEGSVIGSLVNAGLNNIGTLRIEAFRRGDIATEFIFQEIELIVISYFVGLNHHLQFLEKVYRCYLNLKIYLIECVFPF